MKKIQPATTTIRCDICDCIVDEFHGDKIPNWPAVKHSQNGNNIEVLDLCAMCYGSFQRWLAERVDRHIEKELED